MTNARMLLLHPGIDHRLKRGHAIPALSAIKALEPVHAAYPFGFEMELVLFKPPLLTCIAYCIMLTFILPYRYRYPSPSIHSLTGIISMHNICNGEVAHTHLL